MSFSDTIRKLRTEKGLTQAALAEQIGVTTRTYKSYEIDGRFPRKRDTLGKLAEVLGCTPQELLTPEEEFVSRAEEKYGTRGAAQARELANRLAGMFAGGDLPEEEKDAVMRNLQEAYWESKEINKKYTPKKYLKNKA